MGVHAFPNMNPSPASLPITSLWVIISLDILKSPTDFLSSLTPRTTGVVMSTYYMVDPEVPWAFHLDTVFVKEQ